MKQNETNVDCKHMAGGMFKERSRHDTFSNRNKSIFKRRKEILFSSK